jgi:hypothetical protein
MWESHKNYEEMLASSWQDKGKARSMSEMAEKL